VGGKASRPAGDLDTAAWDEFVPDELMTEKSSAKVTLGAARRRLARVAALVLLAASLGGVESLVILPAYSSHYNMSDEELRRTGVSPGTVRVSIGLEDSPDLIADLEQALA